MNTLPRALAPLMQLPHWVVWKLETKKDKPTKVPYQATPPHAHASTKEPATWSTYEQARSVVASFSGVGFMLPKSGIAAFDLDDCRKPETGEIEHWAQSLIECTNSYAEITPSGTGLRILGFGTGAEVHKKLKVPNANGMSCEIYRQATRYITVSGEVFWDRPLANIDEQIDAVAAELDVKENPKSAKQLREKRSRKLPQELRTMLHLQGDAPAEYPSRSELMYAFLHAALRAGVDEADIVAACVDPARAGCSIFEHVRDNNGEKYVEAQIERALNDDSHGGENRKVIIRLTDDNLDEAWRKTEKAVIAADCPVFVRSGLLVQPLWRFERGVLEARFVSLNRVRLRDIVQHHAAIFQKFDGRKGRYKSINPPNDVMDAILEAGHWTFRSVRGIVNTPTMRSDGSLITTPGYDDRTQLWYKPSNDIDLSALKQSPTKADAVEALERIDHLLSGFALVSDIDKSVALAAILTVVLRGAFDVAPMFLVQAPEAGTGKTYLVKIISTIGTGHATSPMVSTKNADEMEKRLSAAALEAKPILNLNNLTHNLDSALLCQMVTEGTVSIRPFGRNDQLITCDCRGVTVFANGNNIHAEGDLVRRHLICRLDAKTAEPEKRTFKFDALAEVRRNRSAYLVDALTIARAHLDAGIDKIAVGVAGFEEWSRFVREPLMWLGLPDPFASMDDARAMDPQRIAFAERIAALVKHIGVGKEFAAADVFDKAMEMRSSGMGGSIVSANAELLHAFTREGKNISTRSIGNQLMTDQGRMSADGYSIEVVKFDKRTAHKYRVARSSDAAPEPIEPM